MVRIVCDELKLDHIIECQNDVSYVAGRDKDNRVRVFLVFNGKGSVYVRNGKAARWEIVDGSRGSELRQSIQSARAGGVSTYRFNGSYQSFTTG